MSKLEETYPCHLALHSLKSTLCLAIRLINEQKVENAPSLALTYKIDTSLTQYLK